MIVLDDSGEAAFAEAICTLFRWLNLPDPAPDIARDRPAILETYRDVTARAWIRAIRRFIVITVDTVPSLSPPI